MDSTGKDFIGHWTWAAKKGLLKENTAGALRSAASAVLEIEPNWETLDVTKLDVDTILRRFHTLKGKEYKTDSLKEYERRFRKAHASFLEYLNDPSSWKPVQERQARGNKSKSEARRQEEAPTPRPPEVTQPAGFVEYPFPLREGRIARMSLPTDLSAAEVKRLSTFLGTLVLDGQ